MQVALVPLDERPVNTGLVQDVAAIAGARCALPEAHALPAFRRPGDVDAIAEWLRAQAEVVDALVVSLDTLVFGGLIPARTTADTVEDAVGRLGVLREIARRRPDLPIQAVSLVTRASDSDSATEEPDYWAQSGRDLHRLGREAHRAWTLREPLSAVVVPPAVRQDFVKRRLRNHIVNLSALRLQWDGVLSYLALTADDTAQFSAGSAEQQWFRYWQMIAGSDLPVVSYPGADETGAVLMARTVLAVTGDAPRVRILIGDRAGLDLTPPYENSPLRTSIERQLAAAGAVITDGTDAELALIVHGPDPDRGDHFSLLAPGPDLRAAETTAALVESTMGTGIPVALADVRYANGGDAALVERLAGRDLLGGLAAYGGWNTAGNALGSAIAMGLATVAGERSGELSSEARAYALRRRLLDDVAYQAIVRRELMAGQFGGRIDPVGDDILTAAATQAHDRLSQCLQSWKLDDGFEVDSVSFPWRRSFEIDIQFG
jgi:hypothetical protein